MSKYMNIRFKLMLDYHFYDVNYEDFEGVKLINLISYMIRVRLIDEYSYIGRFNEEQLQTVFSIKNYELERKQKNEEIKVDGKQVKITLASPHDTINTFIHPFPRDGEFIPQGW